MIYLVDKKSDFGWSLIKIIFLKRILKLNNALHKFVVFEAIRKAKYGGTMCAIHENLSPKLLEEYSEPFELLVVQVEAHKKSIINMTGVGPQENWEESKRQPFFLALEAEV